MGQFRAKHSAYAVAGQKDTYMCSRSQIMRRSAYAVAGQKDTYMCSRSQIMRRVQEQSIRKSLSDQAGIR